MGATRTLNWPRYILGKWRRATKVGLRGSYMTYMIAYNKTKKGIKRPYIRWLALDHKRAKRRWGIILTRRYREF